MGRNRLSGLLLLIAVLAVNLAVARRVFQGEGAEADEARELAFLFGPMALALQLGLWRAFRGRREARPFWAGFMAGGLLAVGGLALAIVTRAPALLAPMNAYEALPRALLYDVALGGSPAAKRYLLARPALRLAYVSAYMFAPQLALAVAAGLAGRFTARRRD
jgi:hypothetical protein